MENDKKAMDALRKYAYAGISLDYNRLINGGKWVVYLFTPDHRGRLSVKDNPADAILEATKDFPWNKEDYEISPMVVTKSIRQPSQELFKTPEISPAKR
jgi:hypothetical protein